MTATQLLQFMADYSRAYVASGGPTSRLEENLSLLGKKLGYSADVYATPTGVFVSIGGGDGRPETILCRIKESSINLERLCWLEGIFEDVFSGKISLTQGGKILTNKRVSSPPYTLYQTIAAAFLSGLALSFTSYGNAIAAVGCGIITTATWWISGPALKNKISSSIFRDFIGCVLTLALSSLFSVIWPAPFEAFSIGGIIVLVPGLSLTTAISELADQNLVSGTAKLMQAMLTVLALGIAFVLFYDLSTAFGVDHMTLSARRFQTSFVASALGLVVSVSCFGILFKVPLKSLPWATVTGLLGWWTLRSFGKSDYIIAASYCASLAVGLLSLALGYRYKVPSQVFSVPGIIALLPGMLALMSFNSLALGQGTNGLELAFRVAITAGSIVFGLFTARIPFALKNPANR